MQISTKKLGQKSVKKTQQFLLRSLEKRIDKKILDPQGFKIQFIESLILAQDERWRRA